MASAMFIATATAYAVSCGAGLGTLTRAGTRPVTEFTIAADPKVLPIGTIVHIEGLGERMVHDTGRLIKGRHIDLFVGSCREARAWGVRKVKVRVSHFPKENVKQLDVVVVRNEED
jgi:3D (Asp-Asp-Asp) domain-containing protein